MYDHVFMGQWMHLSKEIRGQLIKDFNLRSTGRVEVVDQTVVTDGYTNDDLKAFTHESMSKYVGRAESFGKLWELTIEQAISLLNPIEIVLNSPLEVSSDDLEVDDGASIELVDPNRFCNSCDSKGGRHKKECVNYK